MLCWTMPCHFSVLSCKGVPDFLDAWKPVSNVKIADTLLVEAAIADSAILCYTLFDGSSTAYSFTIMT